MKNLILALGQLDRTFGSGGTYLDQMERLAERASAAGAHLILFPELSSIGYFNSREFRKDDSDERNVLCV